MSKENYLELIKQNIVTYSFNDFCVFMNKDIVDSLCNDCYCHVEFTSRGIIYYDEDINEYVSYIYNSKSKMYMLKEASFCGILYKAPKLSKESSIIVLGEAKTNKVKTR